MDSAYYTQHVSYLLWRDTTSELWTPVHSFTLILQPTANTVLFHSLQTNIIFHTIGSTASARGRGSGSGVDDVGARGGFLLVGAGARAMAVAEAASALDGVAADAGLVPFGEAAEASAL